mmetsp:Transcript_17604/g.28918  ORF Transcript_17604/g.28918 Transcript_17604/m.28918 type:complete len:103 (-) Transcript_17604:290-598(-)
MGPHLQQQQHFVSSEPSPPPPLKQMPLLQRSAYDRVSDDDRSRDRLRDGSAAAAALRPTGCPFQHLLLLLLPTSPSAKRVRNLKCICGIQPISQRSRSSSAP